MLRAIDDDALQQNAATVGDVFAQAFAALQERHPLIGDVRGRGLLRGVELVRDRASREPAAAEAERLSRASSRPVSSSACAAPTTTC